MPLLIGRFAGVLLLLIVAAPTLALPEGPEAASRDGVVAPEIAPGEPTPENPESAPAPQSHPVIDVALLALHVVWGGLAAAWLWKRRHTLFLPRTPPQGIADPAATARGLGWILVAAAIFVWFGMATGAGSAQALFKITPEDYETLRGTVLVNAGAYAGGFVSLAFLAGMFRPLAPIFGRRPRPRDVLTALGAYALAHPFVYLTGWGATQIAEIITGGRPIDPLAHETLRALAEQPGGPWWTATVVIAVVVAPLLEEIVYRGLIMNAILRLTRSPGAAIGGSALIFSLMHYAIVAPYALPILFVLGVVFATAYYRTRSLGVSIVMHATFNAINLAMVFLPG